MNCPLCDSVINDDAVFCPFCGTQIEGAEECADYEFEAFVSYRHLPKDRTVAVKLQKALEGFTIPKHLLDGNSKRRLGKCFRDEDELPTSASLSEQIELALKHSRFLIVVCTRETRKSRWVQQEVKLFSSYHGRDRVLVALAEGEPADSFPELLLSKLQRAESGDVIALDVEPMAADFRDLSRKEFNLEAQRVAAALIGCSFDDLRQRTRVRRTRLVAGIASGIAAVSIAFSGVTLHQQAQINENHRQSQINESKFLANESAELLAQGDRYQAIQVALDALPESSTSNDRPFVPAAQMALENALGAYPQESDWRSCYSQTDLAVRIASDDVAFSDTGLQATVAMDGSITVTEVATNKAVSRIDAEGLLGVAHAQSGNIQVALKFAGEKIVVVYDTAIGCFDAREGTLDWSIAGNSGGSGRLYENQDQSLAISPDGKMIAVVELGEFIWTSPLHVLFINALDGRVLRGVEISNKSDVGNGDTEDDLFAHVDFSPDGKSLALGCWGTLYQISIYDQTYIQRELLLDEVASVKYAGGHLTATSQDISLVNTTRRSVSLEVFDDDLNPLWERTEKCDRTYDASGTEYSFNLGVRGTWNLFPESDEQPDQYIALFGNKALLLSVDSGMKVFEITCDSAFLDCAGFETVEPRLFYCTAAGEAGYRNRLDRSLYRAESNPCRFEERNLGVGSLEGASLAEANGEVHLSMQIESPYKRIVFKHAPDLGAINPLALEVVPDGWLHSPTSDSDVVVTADGDVAFLDSSTLEVKSTARLADIEEADLDDYWERQLAVSASGNAYCLLQHAADSGKAGEGGKSIGLYRISGNGASIEGLLKIGGTMIGRTLSVYEYSSNAPMLLITGRMGSTCRVVLFDASVGNVADAVDLDSGDVPGIWQFQASDVRGAWYTGERVIVYANRVSSDSESDPYGGKLTGFGFSLIDPDTSKEIECDLSRYAIRAKDVCNENVSLSDDGKLLSVACSDGAIRLFDANSGSLLWEAMDVLPSVQILAMTRARDVFAIDDQGTCVLLSREKGEVLGYSATPLPYAPSGAICAEGAMHVSFKETGSGGRCGMAIFSLDRDAFGLQSIIYDCEHVASDEGRYVYENEFLGEWLIADCLSLDELIDRAKAEVEGHELTRAERNMYNVGN